MTGVRLGALCSVILRNVIMCFMTKMDMNKAYLQVEIAPQYRHFTGFMTSSGLWIRKKMAFGLRNAPATFSRLVAKVFEGLGQFCEAYMYLDDVIVFS